MDFFKLTFRLHLSCSAFIDLLKIYVKILPFFPPSLDFFFHISLPYPFSWLIYYYDNDFTAVGLTWASSNKLVDDTIENIAYICLISPEKLHLPQRILKFGLNSRTEGGWIGFILSPYLRKVLILHRGHHSWMIFGCDNPSSQVCDSTTWRMDFIYMCRKSLWLKALARKFFCRACVPPFPISDLNGQNLNQNYLSLAG